MLLAAGRRDRPARRARPRRPRAGLRARTPLRRRRRAARRARRPARRGERRERELPRGLVRGDQRDRRARRRAAPGAIVEVVVLADAELITPCGGCRQRLWPSSPGRDTPVHLCGPEGDPRTVTLGELLPLGFARTTSRRTRRDRRPTRPRRWPPSARGRDLVPRVGIVLGSGLGAVADAVEDARRHPLRRAPGLPRRATSPATPGRSTSARSPGSRSRSCRAARTSTRASIRPRSACPCGRSRRSAPSCSCSPTPPARCVPEVGPGRLMALTDHINIRASNPLVGPNDEAVGPRFVAARRAYDPELRARLHAAAEAEGIAPRRRGLPRGQRAELRDPGRDPRIPHARRRRRRDVHGPRGDRRRATAACASPRSPASRTSRRGSATSCSATRTPSPPPRSAPTTWPASSPASWRSYDPIDAARIIGLIDLTSLNEDDTEEVVDALCDKAETVKGPVAAVCVMPAFVARPPSAWRAPGCGSRPSRTSRTATPTRTPPPARSPPPSTRVPTRSTSSRPGGRARRATRGDRRRS